jgi:hypothetical protein
VVREAVVDQSSKQTSILEHLHKAPAVADRDSDTPEVVAVSLTRITEVVVVEVLVLQATQEIFGTLMQVLLDRAILFSTLHWREMVE